MFYFNLLLILLFDFHVHFWLLLSKRAHLKDSSEKRAHRRKTFFFFFSFFFLGGGGGGRGQMLSLSPSPAPEGLDCEQLSRNHLFMGLSIKCRWQMVRNVERIIFIGFSVLDVHNGFTVTAF